MSESKPPPTPEEDRELLATVQELPPEVSPEDDASGLVRSSAVMSVGTALSRVTGFLRLAAAAWAIGIEANRLADSYNLANTTPNILYELALGGILSSVFVPVFVEWMKERGVEAAWDLARRFLTFAIVVLGGLTLLGIALAPQIMRLYTSGIQEPGQAAYVQSVGTYMLRFFLPQIVFYGIGAIAIGLLQAHRRFAAPMFAPILNNLIVIATLIAYGLFAGSARAGATYLPPVGLQLLLAIGTTLGVVAMTVVLWPSLRATGFRFHFQMPRGEGVRQIAHLAKWVVLYVASNQLGYLVVILLATPTTGGIVAYSMAFIMFQLPHAIFAVSIFTALLPALSARWTESDTDAFRDLLARGIRLTAFIVIPSALGYVVLALPIARLLFQHGASSAAGVELVASILQVMALGLFSFSTFQLLLRAFYAMQDTRTPAMVNLGAVALNVIVNLLVIGAWDVRGLAVGLVVSYTAGALTLGALMSRRLGGLKGRAIAGAIGQVVLLSIASTAVAWACAQGLAATLGDSSIVQQLIQVSVSVATGLAAFVFSATMLHMEELVLLRQALGRSRR